MELGEARCMATRSSSAGGSGDLFFFACANPYGEILEAERFLACYLKGIGA